MNAVVLTVEARWFRVSKCVPRDPVQKINVKIAKCPSTCQMIHLQYRYLTLTGSSFGKEQDLEALVDEIGGWIKGEGPTRGPNW